MDSTELLQMVTERAKSWLGEEYDLETRKEVNRLLAGNPNDLIDAFYRTLEFGTGGLRGVMGAGTNRMNDYTVSMATQGLANYLTEQFSHLKEIKVAIAYDSRNNSRSFAETTAAIFSANGIGVVIFDGVRPVPELSYAVRYYGCQSGIVITASHNPKEYNGYKVYWDDGGQIIAPHDENIVKEVNKIGGIGEVKRDKRPELIKYIGNETDYAYINELKKISLSPEIISKWKDQKIVFTPIHGSTGAIIPLAMKSFGFENIISVPEQSMPDGNFPTVVSPNPEEAAALDMAVLKAKEEGADLVMATDPDGDRVGVAVRNSDGEFILLNGNQTASLLLYYLLKRSDELGRLTGNDYIIKTIVTTGLLSNIAEKYKVECYDVLTGFKFIAGLMREIEGSKKFIAGFEESYGYLAGNYVRDKDAVISCALIAEVFVWAKDNGKTLFDLLIDIYVEFGLYVESLTSLVKKGKEGKDEIDALMEKFRDSPPDSINGSPVMRINDYLKQRSFDTISQLRGNIDLPKSNVLQFFLKDGSIISVRPSGTEPKIKFYTSVRAELCCRDKFESVKKELDKRTRNLTKALGVD